MPLKSDNNKPIEQMMKNLKVDPTPSEVEAEAGDFTGSFNDQPMYYPYYYYPGGEYDDHGYYLTNDGFETQYHAVQGENGSFMYYMPGVQPGYVPYNPYMTGATNGIDAQYLSPHSYVLSPMSPHPIASSGYFPNQHSYGSDVMQSYVWDPSFQVVDAAQGNSYVGIPPVPGSKPYIQSHTIAPPKSAPCLKSNSEKKVSLPALDVSSGTGLLNDLKPVDKATSVLAKSYYPITKFPYSSQGKGGVLYPNNPVSYKANGRGWGGTEKFKTRGKGNGVSDFDVLNEQNRGPRTNSVKNISVSETGPAVSLISDGDDKNNSSTVVIRRDDYNLPDFPTKYDHALFFVIKSYSEDDIHKSIKYNVWASTPNGNRRLDSAYQDAQEKMRQKGSKCPVFLFFSVNASGQFCGVAEMIGRVDFNKNMDFWQQDKWNGFFPVKWHFVKDVPNPHFRHIILENNDNKPVTNSRDTQEIRFPQGMNMLNVFKNHLLKTSILDDFTFYESRQKAMQDKRIRAPTPHLAPLQKLDDVQVVGNPQSVETGDAKNSEPVMGDEAKE